MAVVSRHLANERVGVGFEPRRNLIDVMKRAGVGRCYGC